MPKVSIIVPVHNTAPYLRDCVDSLTAQTLRDIEIILVENCSTDNSADLCREIAATDSRIRFTRIEKADLSTARNAGVRIASGEYLAFVDSDDTVLPSMCEEMYSAAADHNLDIVVCNYVKKYDNGRMKYYFAQTGELRIMSGYDAMLLNFRERISKLVCTMMCRRQILLDLPFPENIYNEDRASTFLFLSNVKSVGIIDRAFYIYYQRADSLSHTKDFRKYRDSLLADCIRLRFIAESPHFSYPHERAAAAFKTSNALVRKLGHMYASASSPEQRSELRRLISSSGLIPPGTSLALKQHAILAYLKIWAGISK